MSHSPTRRAFLVATLLAATAVTLALVLTGNSEASEPSGRAKVIRDSKDPRWLHGAVTISAPADRVLDRLARVNEWNKVLTDIKHLDVIKRDGEKWLVRIETRTMDCGAHDYHVTADSNRGVKLVIDAPGINANGFITAKASKREGESSARFSLFVETSGVIGWFIPEKTLWAKQEQMVRRDLEDLARSFARR